MRWIGLALAIAACHHAPPPAPVATTEPAAARTTTPKKPVKIVTDTKVELLDPIRFYAGSPTIDPASMPTIDAIASTLLGNPSLKVVEVVAFGTDAVTSLQVAVATARAQAIVSELVARGVDQNRLRASGMATPVGGLGPGTTFLILARDP
ncbi:MAG TPA: OmpA family protein [Kofleriaceae bacterium]|nr:OmpA family protein [Kofleriaceae bacterium]